MFGKMPVIALNQTLPKLEIIASLLTTSHPSQNITREEFNAFFSENPIKLETIAFWMDKKHFLLTNAQAQIFNIANGSDYNTQICIISFLQYKNISSTSNLKKFISNFTNLLFRDRKISFLTNYLLPYLLSQQNIPDLLLNLLREGEHKELLTESLKKYPIDNLYFLLTETDSILDNIINFDRDTETKVDPGNTKSCKELIKAKIPQLVSFLLHDSTAPVCESAMSFFRQKNIKELIVEELKKSKYNNIQDLSFLLKDDYSNINFLNSLKYIINFDRDTKTTMEPGNTESCKSLIKAKIPLLVPFLLQNPRHALCDSVLNFLRNSDIKELIVEELKKSNVNYEELTFLTQNDDSWMDRIINFSSSDKKIVPPGNTASSIKLIAARDNQIKVREEQQRLEILSEKETLDKFTTAQEWCERSHTPSAHGKGK